MTTHDSRNDIMQKVFDSSDQSELSQLALYIYRQMDRIDWLPFIKASMERNPVCFTELEGKEAGEVFSVLNSFPESSIYDGQRLALPDEVWNFERGDGIEKAHSYGRLPDS